MIAWRWVALLGALLALFGWPAPERTVHDGPTIATHQLERGIAAVEPAEARTVAEPLEGGLACQLTASVAPECSVRLLGVVKPCPLACDLARSVLGQSLRRERAPPAAA